MTHTPPPDIAAQWRARADELAQWAMDRLIVRPERYGYYAAGETWTSKEGEATTLAMLRRHFTGQRIIGALSISLDNHCKWIVPDIDAHGEDVTDEMRARNWRYAHAKFDMLTALGFRPLLTDSNGNGGYHVRVIFSRPIPSQQARAFGVWLNSGWKVFGFKSPPEVFPKRGNVDTPALCGGGWLRLPGKHHSRDFWARVWNGSEWLEGDAAVDAILSHVGDDPALIPAEALVSIGKPPSPEQSSDDAAAIKDENLFGERPPERRPLTLAEVADLLARLAPWRCDQYDAWLHVGMAVHSATSGNAAGLQLWESWSRRSSKFRVEICGKKWESFGDGDITAGSLIHWANEDSIFAIDARHSLQVIAARRTKSGKVTVQVKLLRDNETLIVFDVSSVLSSQQAAVKMLREFVDVAPAALASAIGKIVADADARMRQAAASAGDGETVRAIVTREVPPKFALKFRMGDGKIWSDSFGRGVSRQEFISFTPGWLVDQCRAAADADESDTGLVRSVQSALGVVWASLQETLPNHAAEANNLEAGTAAAEKFAADVFRLWTAPALAKNVSIAGSDGELGMVRASLASLIADIRDGGPSVQRGKWQQIRTAVPAWFRIDAGEGGKLRLAMRYDLFSALRVPCEFSTDQRAVHALGRKFGVFTTDGDVSGRGSEGERLAVLSEDMQSRILAQPDADGLFPGPADDKGGH